MRLVNDLINFLKRTYAELSIHRSNQVLGIFATVFLMLIPVVAQGQPELSAAQLQQIRGLSDAEKRRLAAQAGVTIPQNISPSRVLSETPLAPAPFQSGGVSSAKPNTSPDIAIDPSRKRYGDLNPFGYNLFDSEPTTFAPVGGVPAPEQYVIGPGDRLRIFLFGKESAQYDITVNRDGTLVIPDLDRINVQGLSFEDLRRLIETRVSERKIGVTAVVTLDELRSIQVFVLGDVNQPGSFAVSAFSTLVNALFVAGGISEQGSLRNIQLKRDGKTIAVLDLYDLLLRGDASNDVRVRQGDIIFVPAVGNQVAIRGEVKRPAIFEFKESESIADLVEFASGLSGFAFETEIRIRRTVNGVDRISRSVDRSEIASIQPYAGDIVTVLPVNALPTKAVELAGLFSRPGFREWESGLTLGDIVTSPRDLMITPLESLLVLESRDVQGRLQVDLIRGSEIFADPVVASRGIGNNDRITVVPVQSQNLSDRGEKINSGENRETASFAEKARLNRQEFFEGLNQRVVASSALTGVPPIVEVTGSVNDGGQYPLTTRATVGDLIIAAGGFLGDSDIKSVELVKRTSEGFKIVTVPAANFDQEGIVTAGSQVIVRQDQEKTLLPAVTIRGFVKYPGVYRMPRGSTIGQLIQRAGGMLPNADLRAAVFTREAIKRQETEQLKRLQRESTELLVTENLNQLDSDNSMTDVQSIQLLNQLADAELIGRLVINLPSILAGQTTQDVILEDGDSLVVPSIRQSVTIIGEVLYPSSHVYQLNHDNTDYVELSGGTTSRADMDRAFIVRADGSVTPYSKLNAEWLTAKSSIAMEPGDTIVVPRDLDDLPALDLWTKVTQVIYQSAVALAAIGSL